MNIAIIGSGISGLTSAYLLHRRHDITVFEAGHYIGGHTATKQVAVHGQQYDVDTGFIVFNDHTYPNFIKILDQLQVASQTTSMSFSVRCALSGLEYCGSNLNTLFAQRRNLLKVSFYQMLWDIVRFNRQAVQDWMAGRVGESLTLGEYVRQRGYSEAFVRYYIVAMGAAIWSASTETMLNFPMPFFIRFFLNHGLLTLDKRPQWYTVSGGSQRYVEKMVQPFAHRIRLNTPVQSVQRDVDGVTLHLPDGRRQRFDAVVIATHSDQALKMLADPTAGERDVLGAMPYQANDVVLHTDTRLLPKRRRAWASWNYHVNALEQDQAVLTYNMNMLQNIDAPETFCVTLNETAAIDPSKILGRWQYDHPVFTLEGIRAQQRWGEINGVNRTYFCGAYWGNGFHEDGVNSALKVADAFGERL